MSGPKRKALMHTHDLPEAAASRLKRPLALTRAGMAFERAARAFWPLATVLLLALAFLLSGVLVVLADPVAQALAGALLLGAIVAAIAGLRRYRHPTRAEALAQLDATLAGQPITALGDTQAIGAGDAASRAVWQAHLARMLQKLAGVRAPRPDPDLPRRDPYGLRLIALTAAVAAGLFGIRTQTGDLVTLVSGGPATAAMAGASWEGWIEPPSYTGKPTIYLGDQPPGELAVPVGSRVTLRLYGKLGAIDVDESFSPTPPTEPLPTRLFKIDRDGTIEIGPDRWQITALPDRAPQIAPDGELTRTIAGEMRLPFRAVDDYGISAGQATIALDLARLERRYGLATEPEPREAIMVDLPMPFRGDRAEIAEVLVENLSEHPWAELPVRVVFTANDAAGQSGDSAPVEIVLPGRRFLNPLARAIVEMRRDILWSTANAPRAARILRAISNRPEGLFPRDVHYLKLRVAAVDLEDPALSGELRDEVAKALWDLATEIEDGSLSDALERLRRAQDRLSEAMRQGATPDELSELMQELRDATRDYMRQLAEQGPSEGQPGEGGEGETMELSMQDLQAMMDQIEDLMRQGRTAEAQQLLDMLQEMMENMEMAEGQPGSGGDSPGEQAMQDLKQTLRDQQGLSDQAFRDLQEQGNPTGGEGESGEGAGRDGEQGQGEGGEGSESGQSLAERQRDLENRLENQRRGLPGAGTPEGDAARDALDRAGRAMDEAADELEGGNTSGALDRQAEAMEAMREGMRELDEAMRREAQNQPGQQGQLPGSPGDMRQADPLGRAPGGTGSAATDSPLADGEDVYRRAQDLMEELRRRSGETERPELERDYLKRLLDLF
jgi:uncharacterized protein (TIGR02302 family)